MLSHSVVFDSMRPHGLQPARLLYPWGFPGKNTQVSGHALLQGIFPTPGSNPGLPHGRWILYQLSQKVIPYWRGHINRKYDFKNGLNFFASLLTSSISLP